MYSAAILDMEDNIEDDSKPLTVMAPKAPSKFRLTVEPVGFLYLSSVIVQVSQVDLGFLVF